MVYFFGQSIRVAGDMRTSSEARMRHERFLSRERLRLDSTPLALRPIRR
jgi:hypothetical protein